MGVAASAFGNNCNVIIIPAGQMNRDRRWLLRLPAVYLLLSLCVCLRKPVEAYGKYLSYQTPITIIIAILLFLSIADILVALENGCCGESVNEEAGAFTVCAEILFINGTALTTSNYTVIISEDLTSGSAESKPNMKLVVAITNMCSTSV